MTTVRLPPGPTTPRFVQVLYALTAPRRGMPRLRERYGDAFTVNLPAFGRALVISDPAEIKQLLQTSPEIVDNLDRNLGRLLGPGSLFALRGDEHRRQRKLLVPPFHGRRLVAYQTIVEEEAVREMATWPLNQARAFRSQPNGPPGREFPTLPSMMRITINAILRAVFGAQGPELAELREQLPRAVALGSKLAVLPLPTVDLGRWSPWGRFWTMRRQYDAVVDRLLEQAGKDPKLDERDDILAMMLQSRYDDGTAMNRDEIADQLLTLLVAGHETTATTLAWAVERLRRHPDLLRDLVTEVDDGGSALRQATILEVQRTRPVIDLIGRQVRAESLHLGRWILPRGSVVLVSIGLIHDDEATFPNARAFDPYRFKDAKPDLYQWIPFGGGTRRCLGAAFASMEMDVVLRTMLRDLTLEPTDEPDERWHSRGVASAPAKGGLAVIRRRTPTPATPAGTTTAGARS